MEPQEATRESAQAAQRHSPMQIMAAVSKAAGKTIEDLMGDSRREDLVEARCAFIALALESGYPMGTATDIVDRDRTVGYNYLRKLEGHLRMSGRFQSLLAESRDELSQTKPRAEGEAAAESEEPKPEPLPQPERSPLGWAFTSWDLYRMRAHCQMAARWMRRYGKGRR